MIQSNFNWIKFCKFEKHLKVSKYEFLLIEIVFQISKFLKFLKCIICIIQFSLKEFFHSFLQFLLVLQAYKILPKSWTVCDISLSMLTIQ